MANQKIPPIYEGDEVDTMLGKVMDAHKAAPTSGLASESFVEDKVIKVMAWSNYMGLMGPDDPLPTLDPPQGTWWFQGNPLAGDTTFAMHQLTQTGEGKQWNYNMDTWTNGPQDVASWQNLQAAGANDKYVILANMQYYYVSSLFPLE